MSGLGEFAYTVLLGWVRALFDWFWSMFSGTGNTGAWQWFLSNWKIWLLVLLIGGLVVDWLMWLFRWQPYRLLFGRFRRAPAKDSDDAGEEEAWDDGIGYYAPEIPADVDPNEWTDTTFATLSEIDPDWAGDFNLDADNEPLYDPDYDPTLASQYMQSNPQASASGFWEPLAEDTSHMAQDAGDFAYQTPPSELYADTGDESMYDDANGLPPDFDPYAPYDAYTPADAPQDDPPPPEPEASVPESARMMYGRPGLWPGSFPMADAEPEADDTPAPRETAPSPPPPEPEPVLRDPPPPPRFDSTERYDPLFNPDAPQDDMPTPRRRRRRLHERVDAWAPEDPVVAAPSSAREAPQPRRAGRRAQVAPPSPPPQPAFEETRPSRVIRPEEINPDLLQQRPGRKRGRKGDSEVRTVTGKPAKPRGLRRFASMQEDPISGLPPMDLTDPFLPAVKPDVPDYMRDDDR